MSTGMLVHIWRPACGLDSTYGGISSRVTSLTVTGIRYEYGFDRISHGVVNPGHVFPFPVAVFTPSEQAPEVILVIRDNSRVRWLNLVPAAPIPAGQTPYMAGGNYAGTSDSRWSKVTGGLELISIHDRSETWEQYAVLST